MRRVVVTLVIWLAAVGGAHAAQAPDVVRVAKPAFPPPLVQLTRSGSLRLRLVSTAPSDPGLDTAPHNFMFIAGPDIPKTLLGQPETDVLGQPGTTFVVYGGGVLAAIGPRFRVKYAFDLTSFGFPPKSIAPRAYGPQEVVWARQIGRLLVVQTSHLGYAKDSANRNGYLTAIDLDTGKVRWRSPSLVANAGNFLVVNGMIVSGYGFTAEKDWLYLLDAKTGRVRDRVALPSMAEQLTRSGDRIVARCYDAKVVVRLA